MYTKLSYVKHRNALGSDFLQLTEAAWCTRVKPKCKFCIAANLLHTYLSDACSKTHVAETHVAQN